MKRFKLLLMATLVFCSGVANAESAVIAGLTMTFGASETRLAAPSSRVFNDVELAIHSVHQADTVNQWHAQPLALSLSPLASQSKFVVYADGENNTGAKAAKITGGVVLGVLVLSAIGVKLIADGLDDKAD